MSTAIAPPPILNVPRLPAPVAAAPPPDPTLESFGGMAYLRRFTVDEYHRMIDANILTKYDPVELLEGYLVLKMSRSIEHDYAIMALNRRLSRILSEDYVLRPQCAATFDTSEPEPDISIARGSVGDFRKKHPGPTDLVLLIEISASSLKRDRGVKLQIYARGGIPIYWVVNVDERTIEVYSEPAGSVYGKCTEYAVGDSVPVILDGNPVGTIAVADLMA